MKTIYITIFTLLLALPGTGLYAQPTYDLQFRLEQNEATVNGIYEVTAQIKANVDTFRMGSSNLVFTYNTAALSSPDPIGPGPDTLQIQAIHNFSGGGDYAKITLTEPAAGRMSLNIELFEPDSGAIVPMSFVDIATIRFTIEDETELSNLAWRSESPNPLTLFQNDEATVLNSASLADEVLLADLKVFLEGPYSGGSTMITDLNTYGSLPLSQPYNVAPWNYPGAESVASMPVNVVDWVLLQIRSSDLPEDSVTSRAAFLRNDGMIVDLNGVSPVTFNLPDNDYHVVVFHRNHLAAMNASLMPLNKASDEAPYDFTTDIDQFYGSIGAHELETDVWGMAAADGNSDGGVYLEDYILYQINQGAEGYEVADYNLDGGVYLEDYILYQLNQGEESGTILFSDAPGGSGIPSTNSDSSPDNGFYPNPNRSNVQETGLPSQNKSVRPMITPRNDARTKKTD